MGLVEALFGAMNHAAALSHSGPEIPELTAKLRKAIHSLMVAGQGTRDLCGPEGLTTVSYTHLTLPTKRIV